MVMETNSQGTLYCTFNDKDIYNHFLISADEFLGNRNAIMKFSNILLKKAAGTTALSPTDEVIVTVYQMKRGNYTMCIDGKPENKWTTNSKDYYEWDQIYTSDDIGIITDFAELIPSKGKEIIQKDGIYHLIIEQADMSNRIISHMASKMGIESAIVNKSMILHLKSHGEILRKG